MKLSRFVLIVLLVPTFAFAQVEMLSLNYKCQNQSQKSSTNILSIDNREKGQLLGFISKGLNGKIAEIRYEGSLVDSLAKFFGELQTKDEIVLMLNEFNLWEFNDSDGQFGRFKLSLRAFRKGGNDLYHEFMVHDSIYSVKSQFDVTRSLLISVSNSLCYVSKIASNQLLSDNENNKAKYTFQQLAQLDSLEKENIPLYHIQVPKQGIYSNYHDLSQNSPTIPCEVIVDDSQDDKIKVKRVNIKGKPITVENKDIYAVSDGKRFYKSLSMGFFEIVKEGNDFYYVRPKSQGQAGGYLMAPMMGGVVGGAVGGAITGLVIQLGAKKRTKLIIYKINYRRGSAIAISTYDPS